MAAPEGNKFALGMNGGRPPKYADAQALVDKITQFFEWCKGESHKETISVKEKDDSGQLVDVDKEVSVWDRYPETPNITNLALFLGFESRQSFYDYGAQEEFSYTIKRAKLVIENYYENHLLGKESTGAIFALKNFGWKDKVELGGEDGQPIKSEVTHRITPEDVEVFSQIFNKKY